jgi:putative phosphoesterase
VSRLRVEAPLTIGVLADTHASPTRGQAALSQVRALFERVGVGLILHAGDVGEPSVLRDLEAVAPVAAVRGNADPLALIEALPDRVEIEAGPHRVLLLHGHHGKTARAAAKAAAAPEIALIVYGHSHRPLIERAGETVLFNPGSPTERRWNPHFGVGLIAVTDERIDPELVLFTDPTHLVNVRS